MVFGGGRHVRQLITVIHEWALVLDIHGQIDVTFLDFAKAFDSVSHEQLLLKADYYWIANICLWSFSFTVIYEWALILDIHGQIDVTFLDFAKAFDSVSHEQLLLKADYYWIANICLWSFPTERTTSGRVVSRVPQGTVLGPILFLKLINDLPTKITSSIKLLADDCVPYRPINSAGDQFAL